MKLNHINLTVKDVPQSREFLEKYFGMQPIFANNNLAVLSDDVGLILTLTSMKIGGETDVKYPANFHIGFGQETQTQVDEIHRRLRDDGFDVPPPSKQHGAWTFYFEAPGDFTIEVLSPLAEED